MEGWPQSESYTQILFRTTKLPETTAVNWLAETPRSSGENNESLFAVNIQVITYTQVNCRKYINCLSGNVFITV
jgi:hypothetical protein